MHFPLHTHCLRTHTLYTHTHMHTHAHSTHTGALSEALDSTLLEIHGLQDMLGDLWVWDWGHTYWEDLESVNNSLQKLR